VTFSFSRLAKVSPRWWALCAAAAVSLACSTSEATAQEPWRLGTATDAPDWLTLSGETRARYESLDGQFRAGGAGSDQALSLRTLLLAEAKTRVATFGFELQDSRALFDDSGTSLTTSTVNPLDILQAYARVDLDGVLGQREAHLILGRQTIDVGSGRVIERVDMSNVIAAYTGAYWTSRTARGDEWHVLAVVPVGRQPSRIEALGDDTPSQDDEEWGRRFWGVHYRRANALGAVFPDLWAEAFIYGIDERDTAALRTPERHYVQPGFRLLREAKAGRFDLEIEGSYRFGARRATTDPGDTRDLDVSAATLHAALGYTFDRAWRPRLALDLDYASGDDDPGDASFDQYETLFGGRRGDLGATGLYGPLAPANLIAPGARIELKRGGFDAHFAYKAAFLESETDFWVPARVRDSSGGSGRFIGHAFDARLRYWLAPQSLRLELGAATLIQGRFAQDAPNASRQGDPLFGYAQISATF